MATPHQRANRYNRFLPYADRLESDADDFYAEVKADIEAKLRTSDRNGLVESLFDLNKYTVLHGLRFSKADHVYFVKTCFDVIVEEELGAFDTAALNKVLQLLLFLIKKKYLLSRADLTLPWRPLFNVFERWEDSSYATRQMLKPQAGFRASLKTVIKYCRAYFPEEATSEMLELWSPLLCPTDRTMAVAMKYFSLFLPTNCELQPEKSYKLWFERFMSYWDAFSNSPSWDVEVFQLMARLAFHNVGRIDWTPYVNVFFNRIMTSFDLPVSYAGSDIRLKYGMTAANSVAVIVRWIVSAVDPHDGLVFDYLERFCRAIESYYQPANFNRSSESLHAFLSSLCVHFVHRVHIERYNKKWKPKTPEEKRLTDDDITRFVNIVKPIAFHILFSAYEDDKKKVFNVLSTLRPKMIIPELLEKLESATASLTEPHRFTACVSALSACARPFVENYPEYVIDTLLVLLPGMDVNDIGKCADNFILMSDLLEMIWVVDFSGQISGADLSEKERELLAKTSQFEYFVSEFTDKCFTLVENSKRQQTRAESDVMEETLNDEEIAVDYAIADTFQKMMLKSSPQLFKLAFNKLKAFVSGRVFEAAVSGSILANMCKSAVSIHPELALDFFIPHLCDRVSRAQVERVDEVKIDVDLQFSLLLLSEVISIKSVAYHTAGGSYVLKYLDPICDVLDKTLDLKQKDEYEHACNVLQNLLNNLLHTRPLQKSAASNDLCHWDRDVFKWGKSADLDYFQVEWYEPTKKEILAAQKLVDRYLTPAVEKLGLFAQGKVEMEKEEVVRHIRQIYKIAYGCSEVMEAFSTDSHKAWGFRSLEKPHSLTFNGVPLRTAIMSFTHELLSFMMVHEADDTDSLTALTSIIDTLVRSFGMDEDDLGDFIDEYKAIKAHRENKMIKSKCHLASVLYERISLQHETFVWLKNTQLTEVAVPHTTAIEDFFALSTSHYSDCRIYSQDLLLKTLSRCAPKTYKCLIPKLVKYLQSDEEVTHQMFKGALYLIDNETSCFIKDWEDMLQLAPAVIKAQHSDKDSIVDLLKDIAIRWNRSVPSECLLYLMPTKIRKASDSNAMDVDGDDAPRLIIDPNYVAVEKEIVRLLDTNLHWRHRQLAYTVLLFLIVPEAPPSGAAVEKWLDALLADDRVIRDMAFQALDGIMKINKIKRKRFQSTDLVSDADWRPGVKPSNEWMQYRSDLDLEAYWDKPFSVKPYMGFSCYEKSPVTLHLVDENGYDGELEGEFSESVIKTRQLFKKKFSDASFVKKFVELNTLEHKKGEDRLSTDKALFHAAMFESFGDWPMELLGPHVKRCVTSTQEDEQRFAAEVAYGLMRGSRFWGYRRTKAMWEQHLVPLFNRVLENVNTESLSDWETCLNGATNKLDNNRIRWLLELLVDKELLFGKAQAAFKESSYLKLLNRALTHNWKIRELYHRTYDILREQWAHPYNKVRLEVAKVLATIHVMDTPFADGVNAGENFPRIGRLLDEIIPKLTLNMHNPEMNGVVKQNGNSSPMDTTATEASSEVEENDEDSEANRVLQTISVFVTNYIQASAASINPELYRLLPFLCQYTGNEKNEELTQSCLRALCFLSVCTVQQRTIPAVLEMINKVKASESWKSKISMLEFVQVFVWTNFMFLCRSKEFVQTLKSLIVNMLSDENLQVRQKAAGVFTGLAHSRFLDYDEQKELIVVFKSKVRTKMTRKNKNKFTKEDIKSKLGEYHSGILGLCSIVEAYPYDVPEFLPDVLMELSRHLHDPQPIPKTIKESMQEFKRPHQDHWEEHKTKFTEDQLLVMTDLLVSPNYYA